MEKTFPTEKECTGPTASVTGGGSSKKLMVSFINQIPKKSRKEAKHCALCKKHGGSQNTHNNRDFRKYKKDSTSKMVFVGKSVQCNP
jgi:hypothetical protein